MENSIREPTCDKKLGSTTFQRCCATRRNEDAELEHDVVEEYHLDAPIQNTVIVGGYLTKPASSGVGALVAQNRYQEKNTRKAGTSNGGPGAANQSDQQAKQGNADQTEPTRHPSLGSWNVMPAVGREQLYFSILRVPVLVSVPFVCCSVLGSAPEGSALNPPFESPLVTRPSTGGQRRSSLEPRRVARPQRWSFERFGKVVLLLCTNNGDHNGLERFGKAALLLCTSNGDHNGEMKCKWNFKWYPFSRAQAHIDHDGGSTCQVT